jgi:ribonuclease P protein component
MTPPDERRFRVGFVVSKAVGNAVTRNLVKRRLRSIVGGFIYDGSAPDSGMLVLRALPASASVSFQRLYDEAAAAVRSASSKARSEAVA